MEACDVYEVDPDAGSLKLLVSYEDWELDEDVGTGQIFALEEFASSALAVSTRQPVLITSPDDPQPERAEAASSSAATATAPSSASRCASATA